MGWYDAYKTNTFNAQALSMIDSKKGMGASAFGNAFTDFGNALNEHSDNVAKDELSLKQNALTDLKITNEATKATDMYENKEILKQDKVEAKKQDMYNNAFKKDLLTKDGAEAKQALIDYAIGNEDKFYGKNGVDFKALEYGKKLIDKDNANDTKNSVEIARLNKAKDDLVWQNKLNKANKGNKKDGFVYDEKVGAKIVTTLKASMGYDAPNFTMSDAQKVEFEKDLFGIANISKEYKLEPLLALDVYRHPDKYMKDPKKKTILENPNYDPNPEPNKDVNSDEIWKNYQ